MTEVPHPELAPAAAPAPARGRAPWLRFAAIFGFLAIVSELAYYGLVLESETFQSYLRVLARLSGVVLGWFDVDVTVRQAQISSPGFAVEVAHGCDALQVSALLSAAVIAFPARLRRKLVGIGLGLLLLQAVNLLRIVSLFLIGAHYADVFQITHEVVWPTVLIVITISTWIVWVRQETRGEDRPLESRA